VFKPFNATDNWAPGLCPGTVEFRSTDVANGVSLGILNVDFFTSYMYAIFRQLLLDFCISDQDNGWRSQCWDSSVFSRCLWKASPIPRTKKQSKV